MNKEWFTRMLQVAVVTITLAAVLQELEKPREEREWRGQVFGVFPYSFRLPAVRRLKETFWNPYSSQIFTAPAFGIGWGINFYALLENLRIIGEVPVSEEDFLMPTLKIRETMKSLVKQPK